LLILYNNYITPQIQIVQSKVLMYVTWTSDFSLDFIQNHAYSECREIYLFLWAQCPCGRLNKHKYRLFHPWIGAHAQSIRPVIKRRDQIVYKDAIITVLAAFISSQESFQVLCP
jgi:hypothetical protein